jgi:hypothetical protein
MQYVNENVKREGDHPACVACGGTDLHVMSISVWSPLDGDNLRWPHARCYFDHRCVFNSVGRCKVCRRHRD